MLWMEALVLLTMVMSSTQDDYSNPIMCYSCYGRADDSPCAKPIDPHNNPVLHKRQCRNGVCIKWTRYKHGVLYLERTCSSLLNIKINLIHGVCRYERDGNGYLCMCGKHLCNVAIQKSARLSAVVCLVTAFFLISRR